jgi:hypothetical protein
MSTRPEQRIRGVKKVTYLEAPELPIFLAPQKAVVLQE